MDQLTDLVFVKVFQFGMAVNVAIVYKICYGTLNYRFVIAKMACSMEKIVYNAQEVEFLLKQILYVYVHPIIYGMVKYVFNYVMNHSFISMELAIAHTILIYRKIVV